MSAMSSRSASKDWASSARRLSRREGNGPHPEEARIARVSKDEPKRRSSFADRRVTRMVHCCPILRDARRTARPQDEVVFVDTTQEIP